MGHSEPTLTGPDLKRGIAIDTMSEGQKLLGHVDGLPVLLIRGKDTFHAIGAKCSHYGADLDQGLLTNGTIRCPWHHACFDVKTGEAIKTPALNPIPAWKTEIQNGVVYVREQQLAPTQKIEITSQEHYVIIGSGAAGHVAAETLRRLNFAGKITILSADSDFPYDRPNLSKDYLAGNAPEEWMPLRPPSFFSDRHIDLQLNCKVKLLDSKAKTLALEDGRVVSYDKCLIATGGAPVKPEITGIDHPHVHFLRSFADCRRLIASLDPTKRVVIVGAGFIGLEAAAALKARKLDVVVVAPGTFPLEHAVGSEVGKFLKSLHEQNRVHFRLGESVKKIEKGRVLLRDGTTELADVVLIATGIKPVTAFAAESGLQIKDGILVDEYLETNIKGIYAAGDIARWPSPFSKDPLRIEHWVVAQRQGQIAASNMLGLKKKYSEVPFFWSQQFDVVLNFVGVATPLAETRIYGKLADKKCAVAYIENKLITGVLTIGLDLQSLEIEKAFEGQDQRSLTRILNAIKH